MLFYGTITMALFITFFWTLFFTSLLHFTICYWCYCLILKFKLARLYEHVILSPKSSSTFSPLFFFSIQIMLYFLCHLQTFFLNSYVQDFFPYATVTSEKNAQKWFLKLSKKNYDLKYVMNNLLAKKHVQWVHFGNKE